MHIKTKVWSVNAFQNRILIINSQARKTGLKTSSPKSYNSTFSLGWWRRSNLTISCRLPSLFIKLEMSRAKNGKTVGVSEHISAANSAANNHANYFNCRFFPNPSFSYFRQLLNILEWEGYYYYLLNFNATVPVLLVRFWSSSVVLPRWSLSSRWRMRELLLVQSMKQTRVILESTKVKKCVLLEEHLKNFFSRRKPAISINHFAT